MKNTTCVSLGSRKQLSGREVGMYTRENIRIKEREGKATT